jgi:hypothetical protein
MATKRDSPLYDDIWEHIKKHHKCKVAAHPALHKRIVHAVINKKYYDLTNKFELLESKKHTKLLYVCELNQITFKLQVYDDFKRLTSGDI